MEVNIFPQPAVAGVLTKNYVEARLHTDSHDADKRPILQALQMEMQGSQALPFYISYDPWSREQLATFNRADKAILDPGVFRAFLLDGVSRATTEVADASR